jgi:hypothetical protein
VRRAATDLVRERFMLEDDVDAVVRQADETWTVVAQAGR